MENPAMQKIIPWDQTSDTNPTTFIQMMKSLNMIDHLPLVASYHALTEDQLSSIRTKLIPKRNLRHCTKKQKEQEILHQELTPEERARSLLLPTSDETEGVPRERSESQDQGDEGQGDTSSVPSTI
jgi:hypothetical protein